MADNGGVRAPSGPPAVRGAPAGAGDDRLWADAGVTGPSALRHRLALALDFDDSVLAMRWAMRMKDTFGVAKVGLELFCAAGPSVVAALVEAGLQVFVDLKFADIPTQTRKAARVLGSVGASYLTVHGSAGPSTLRAGVEGFAEGAERGGLPVPVTLGVTVLTSEAEAPPELVRARVRAAAEAGCGGVVCAASDLVEAKSVAPRLLAVVPGIRLAGDGTHDHGRAATPGEAALAGADLLVIGRAVTQAADPEAAAAAVMAELAAVAAL
jgi:orotidine-5'-phosphate decarboxylase